MEIGSAFSAGIQGFQRASANITEATQNINNQQNQQSVTEQQRLADQPQQAATQTNTPSLASSIVTLASESHVAQANVRAIETADEVLGSIIDLRV